MAPPAWIILGAVPRVSELDDADLSLALAAPPRISVLTVPPRVSPIQADPTSRACPWVLTADPASGLLLLSAPPPPPTPTPPRPATFCNGVRLAEVGYIKRQPPTYFVCDVTSATAFRLPQPGRDPSGLPEEINALNLGVVAAPGAGGGAGRYMVVEFRYMFADQHATLLCFSSDTGEWEWKPVHNPLGRWIWGRDGVVAHDGKLWWVDLAGGLIFCDPFADAPVLDIVPLPESDCHVSDASCAHCAGRSMAYRRFVQVSAGKFRWVEWSSHRDDEAPMTVTMWTLNDPEAKEWVLEYKKVSFQEIWADDSYKAAGLTEKNPTFALVHPMNPDVLYFFLEEQLFGVDLRAKRVVECSVYEMVVPPSGKPPNCFSVHALELPIALSAGSLPSDVGSGSNRKESTPLASSVSQEKALSLQIEFEEGEEGY
ncbi:uncharacterized protein LOC123439708 isoform X2 [Hordeum vulgare subsp. vulgare]|uniref:Predicted protein n=1 Tax=Hordeum vulgare subsp. vulgare TaxID=112509 RepID=F2EF38_HORVV|nr:uncharacterized protein LOC123439708 isoform X2 [Hordeum vulgare subsp. vulgare]BAK05960.1 predicted protein [Hordeum vulgare subsp. vulgare]